MRFGFFIVYVLVLVIGVWVVLLIVIVCQNFLFNMVVIIDFVELWVFVFLFDNCIFVIEKRGQLCFVDLNIKVKGIIIGVFLVCYGGQGGFGDVVLYFCFFENNLVYISYVEVGIGGFGVVVVWVRLVFNISGGGVL